METRLASARQLLVSQEEAIRSRDEDRRQLKARLVTVELHTRGKDARIQQLTVSFISKLVQQPFSLQSLLGKSQTTIFNPAIRYCPHVR